MKIQLFGRLMNVKDGDSFEGSLFNIEKGAILHLRDGKVIKEYPARFPFRKVSKKLEQTFQKVEESFRGKK